ncbi:MAG: zf-HC2 domain-containing protein [Acidimicrobiales bacterium]|nr:zf-HC2 domain-containing protein [Acidimicrobiales bacterium]
MPDARPEHLDGPDGPHLGDALSALVDGELSPAEEAEARRHLDGCAECTDELAATQATADLVRGLPAVDPRFGFYERMLRPSFGSGSTDRRRVRIALSVASAAAVVALVVGLASNLSGTEVTPAVDDMVEIHEAGFVPSTGFAAMAPEEMGGLDAPAQLEGGFQREAVYQRDGDDTVAAAYRSDTDTVTVFEQDGDLDDDALDDHMEPMDAHAWAMEAGDGMHAVVVERAGVVYTVVGDASMAVLLVVGGDLPDGPAPSLLERARGAGAEVVWTFGLGS